MSDNPSAFPLAVGNATKDEIGMSLRDWFAGQALSSVLATCYQISSTGVFTSDAHLAENVADKAYAIADAMLKQRAKQNG